MKLTSKRQIRNFLNDGYDIMIIPFTEDVIDFSSAVFWKKDGKIYTWGKHLGTVERTDKTEEEIIEHIANYLTTDNYIINAAGY